MTDISTSIDLLNQLRRLHNNDDLKLCDTFFTYLAQETNILSTAENASTVQELAMKHVVKAQTSHKKTASSASTTTSASTKSSASSSSSSSSHHPIVSLSSTEPELKVELKDQIEADQQPSTPASTTASSKASSSPELIADDEDPSKLKPSIGNGSSTSQYTWTQSLSLVEATIALPSTVQRKQVDVTIDVQHLYVKIHDQVIVDAALHSKVDTDESTWTIETSRDGKQLSLYLPKLNGMEWWSRLVEGEREINVRKIQPENSKLSDLEPDVASTVNRMMFNQRQKAAGKPTSEEQEKQDALKRFMQMHPEMDFSKAKISM